MSLVDASKDFYIQELHSRYTFETFVLGPSNENAHAAAQDIVAEPVGQNHFFYLYSRPPMGLGMTHLMHAIGHVKKAKHQDVLYTTAECFVNEYIEALASGSESSFRSKHRGVDCLMVDDIQFLIGKPQGEEEFCATVHAIMQSGTHIVTASDRHLRGMGHFGKRLRSMAGKLAIAEILHPNYETRHTVVRAKAAAQDIELPEDVAQFLAKTCRSNIRELEGGLIRVKAYCYLSESPITVEKAREILRRDPDRTARG